MKKGEAGLLLATLMAMNGGEFPHLPSKKIKEKNEYDNARIAKAQAKREARNKKRLKRSN